MKIYRQNFENLHIEEVQDEIKKVETPAKVMYAFKVNLKNGGSIFMYLNHNVVLQIIDNINNNISVDVQRACSVGKLTKAELLDL